MQFRVSGCGGVYGFMLSQLGHCQVYGLRGLGESASHARSLKFRTSYRSYSAYGV